LALLLPVIPSSLEMYALRRMTTSAFGTLMCLEPAIALVAGLALLGQVPRVWSLAGVAFVIAAGLGAERSGARTAPRAPRVLAGPAVLAPSAPTSPPPPATASDGSTRSPGRPKAVPGSRAAHKQARQEVPANPSRRGQKPALSSSSSRARSLSLA
jgi:inner membrane transporter RhtA